MKSYFELRLEIQAELMHMRRPLKGLWEKAGKMADQEFMLLMAENFQNDPLNAAATYPLR